MCTCIIEWCSIVHGVQLYMVVNVLVVQYEFVCQLLGVLVHSC